jgi:YD repeat-containing protein
LPVDDALRLSFDFEEGKGFGPGAIEPLARSAQMAVQQVPFMTASYPFFEAAQAGDWFCGKALIPAQSATDAISANKVRRLRCIKFGSATLLENSYDADGRVASVCYFDGEATVYDWDDVGRVFRARSKSGRQTEIKLRHDDLPQSITYDGTHRFQYEYDQNANVTRLEYPDGIRVERTFGHRGQLTTVGCGPLHVKFRWNDSDQLESYTLHDGSRTFEFHSNAKQHKCDLTMTVKSVELSSFPIVHPLGAWRMNGQKDLEEMLTPWGERFRVIAFGPSGPEAVWSSSGLHRFDYNKAGGFVATTSCDGSRSMLYVLEGQDRALLINPLDATLLELDRAGRMRKALGGGGRYSLIDYTREGKVKRVATFTETFSVFRDSRGLLSALHSDCGYACRLVNSAAGNLVGLVAEGMQGSTAEEVRRMLKFLWQCLGLRTIHSLITG